MHLAAEWLPWVPIGLVCGAGVFAARATSPLHDLQRIVRLGSSSASYGAFIGVFIAGFVQGTIVGARLTLTDVMLKAAGVGGATGAMVGVSIYLHSVADVISTTTRRPRLAWLTVAWWSFLVPVGVSFVAWLTLPKALSGPVDQWSYVWPGVNIVAVSLWRMRHRELAHTYPYLAFGADWVRRADDRAEGGPRTSRASAVRRPSGVRGGT